MRLSCKQSLNLLNILKAKNWWPRNDIEFHVDNFTLVFMPRESLGTKKRLLKPNVPSFQQYFFIILNASPLLPISLANYKF